MNLVTHLAQHLRYTHGNGRMGIMSASVFYARDERFVGNVQGFIDRQRIHIRPECHDRPRFRPFDQRNHAMSGYVGPDLIKTQCA